jgi:hypothetical protein
MMEEFCTCLEGPKLGKREYWAKPRCGQCHLFVSHQNYCRVYWGSHGCKYPRGHEGDHKCICCECEVHPEFDSEGSLCAGAYPYYGVIDMETVFYGEDVPNGEN